MFAVETRVISDPVVEVHSMLNPAAREIWRISRDLDTGDASSDNDTNGVMELLRNSPALLDRLRSQRRGKNCSLARKDGQFGLLYAFEYRCHETHATFFDLSLGKDEEHMGLPTRAQVIDRILAASRELSREFATTRFAMPVHPLRSADGLESGPVLWAFVRDGLLGAAESAKLLNRAAGI